jgi:hypothetical protein
MTWVLLLWTALFAVWIGGGIADSAGNTDCNDPAQRGSLSVDACNAAGDVGTGIGVALVFILWFVGFLILALVWLMSRPKRVCPVCGESVKKGRTSCKKCGHDFRLQAPPPSGGPLESPAA